MWSYRFQKKTQKDGFKKKKKEVCGLIILKCKYL